MGADSTDPASGHYPVLRQPAHDYVDVRGLRYHVCRWGPPDGRPVVLLHGWMDCGATFQFLVDALPADWQIIAPDWRGFGETDHGAGSYYFPDYLADLDRLLDLYFAQQPVLLVGHSMGGNAAGLYAGIRPERISHLVSIEGFGLAATRPEQAPNRYAQWLDSLKAPMSFRAFEDFQALAGYLRMSHRHLRADRAAFIARCWGRLGTDGKVHLRGDPAHKRPNPVLYRLDEAMACWRNIAAATLWIRGSDSQVLSRIQADTDYAERSACIGEFQELEIPEAGHSVHLEQPEALAEAIHGFVTD